MIPLKQALDFLHQKQLTDLSVRQLSVLLKCAEDKQTVRGLAETLEINKPAVTRAADKLEENGWLERKLDTSDRRSVFLVLTRSGRKFAENFV